MKRKINNEKVRKWRARKSRTSRAAAASGNPQITVFRSAKHIYAQLIDSDGKTLGTVSTRSKAMAGDGGKVAAAKRVGAAVAELARDKKIEKAVFNRNGFLFHGRVKALADAAREAGLKF